jgi:hypothetical protein
MDADNLKIKELEGVIRNLETQRDEAINETKRLANLYGQISAAYARIVDNLESANSLNLQAIDKINESHLKLKSQE